LLTASSIKYCTYYRRQSALFPGLGGAGETPQARGWVLPVLMIVNTLPTGYPQRISWWVAGPAHPRPRSWTGAPDPTLAGLGPWALPYGWWGNPQLFLFLLQTDLMVTGWERTPQLPRGSVLTGLPRGIQSPWIPGRRACRCYEGRTGWGGLGWL
jgi:hypothetical protein